MGSQKHQIKEDIEKQLIATQQAEPNAHILIRQRFNSGDWWVVLGFQSEEKVRKIIADIKATPAEVETIEYPVQRLGEYSGPNEDVFLMVFIKKTTIEYEPLAKIFRKHGVRAVERTDQDVFPISFGFHNALLRTIQMILEQHEQLEN
jgi:hypothetical protein